MKKFIFIKLKSYIEDLLDYFIDVLFIILNFLFSILKKIINLISSFFIIVFSFFFPFGIYFTITVIFELLNGIDLLDTKNWGFSLLFFIIPLFLMIINIITRE